MTFAHRVWMQSNAGISTKSVNLATTLSYPESVPAATRLGLISDTHGLLRPEALRLLAGSGTIVHAGDVGNPEILQALGAIAPVTAVRGNIDTGPWAAELPATAEVRAQGARIYVLHDLHELDIDPRARGFDIVVSGHSHRPGWREANGVLYINPGAAGRRRFRLPVTLATLDLAQRPWTPLFFDLECGGVHRL